VVAGVAIGGEIADPVTLEVGRGDVVEDQTQGHVEERCDTVEELLLELLARLLLQRLRLARHGFGGEF
jgi:hypothetical protein